MRLKFSSIDVGDKVTLEMSPYDLSKGGIIDRATRENAVK
jgi:translation initiation factor IF-1